MSDPKNSSLWKSRLIPLFVLLVVLLVLDIIARNYADLIYQGELPVMLCLCKVEALDTSEEIDQIVTVKITSGPFKGQRVYNIPNIWVGKKYSDRILHKGDKLFLEIPIRKGHVAKIPKYKLFSKIIVPEDVEIKEADLGQYFRSRFLLFMMGMFGGLLILVGGTKGLRAIGGLFVSGLAMLLILVPLLAKGYNPLLIALIISAFVTSVTFLIIGGISKKAISGALGTLGGLLACGVLALYFNRLLHFTGLDVEFGHMKLGRWLWQYEINERGWHWNHSGLLTAGMVIGALGAMMDVTMAIASAVTEVKKANPKISVRYAIRSGFNVGRDIMGTMANTLIFAYMGADMTIMIMPGLNYPDFGRLHPFLKLINQEGPAVEITQALLGTIGLVLAIPITAVVAGLLTAYERVKSDK